MVCPAKELPLGMVALTTAVNGRNGLTRSCQGISTGVDSLSWPQKLVDGGLWKPATFCVP